MAVFLSGCVQQTPPAQNATATPAQKSPVYFSVVSPPTTMREQLKAGAIDGFIAWEPFNADAVENGEGSYLVQSGDVWPNHPCCVVAASNNFGDEDVTKALVWAHIKATEFITNLSNHDKVVQYASEFTTKNSSVVEEALKTVKYIEYPDAQEIRTYYKKLNERQILKKNLSDIGYDNESAFFNSFLARSYYDAVKTNLANDKNWKPEPVNKTVRLGYLIGDLHQLAFYVAKKEGYYGDVGLNISEKVYNNGPLLMSGFSLGEIDFGYLGSAPATMKRINDDIKIRIIAGANNEGSAIVVRKAINSTSDLSGKTIAIPGLGTVQDFILRMVVEKSGLEIKSKG